MSSTRTISSSLERPITISPSSGRGNSPPWYFPEMKRSANGNARPSITNSPRSDPIVAKPHLQSELRLGAGDASGQAFDLERGVNRRLWVARGRMLEGLGWPVRRLRSLVWWGFWGRFRPGPRPRTSANAGGPFKASILRSTTRSPWRWWPEGSWRSPNGPPRGWRRSSDTNPTNASRSS